MLTKPVKSAEPHAQFRAPRRALSLPAYDIRMRKELAQRRLLVALGRQAMRVVSLHMLDAAVVIVAVIGASMLTSLPEMQSVALRLAALVLLGLNARNAYNASGARRDPVRIATGVVVAAAALALIGTLPFNSSVPLSFLLSFSVLAITGIVIERWLVELGVREAYARGIGLRKAVIVGRHAEVQEVISALDEDRHGNHCVVGYVTPTSVLDQKALGSVDEIDAIL
ncbi:MAG TPA: hypothetical protein VIP11_00515, partial [Gemmatimonadaceae bacterium]